MKKFTYSAVAIVLFSFAGIASEKNEKKELKKATHQTETIASKNIVNTETKKTKSTTVKANCVKIATDLMELHEGEYSGVLEYWMIWCRIYKNCMDTSC